MMCIGFAFSSQPFECQLFLSPAIMETYNFYQLEYLVPFAASFSGFWVVMISC